MDVFGIHLLGVNARTGQKLLLSLGLLVAVWLVAVMLGVVVRALTRGHRNSRDRGSRLGFWLQQGRNVLLAGIAVLGLFSIWFEDPAHLTAVTGMITAGLAFALQKVVTSFAGYLLILRGRNFTVGDRITMGGVRGDVVGLGFFQTTILEMGEPPSSHDPGSGAWIHSRQFTGRIVTVSNSQIFEEPVYNYTSDFPFIWEEMRIPVAFRDDRDAVEGIMLDAARKHAVRAAELEPGVKELLARRYHLHAHDFEPKVYWRITDNWMELTVRLLVHDHGSRRVKDAMSREIIAGLDAAGIGIASSTFEVVGLPPVTIRTAAGGGTAVPGPQAA